jgi:hypothetical protein
MQVTCYTVVDVTDEVTDQEFAGPSDCIVANTCNVNGRSE